MHMLFNFMEVLLLKKENCREELKFILSDVIDWLKFAEAKNVGLITLNLALIAINFDLLSNPIFKTFKILIYFMILFNLSSLSVCVLSFYPQVANLKILKKLLDKYISVSNNDNLLFYRVIASFNKQNYINKLKDKYMGDQGENFIVSIFDIDLCDQIVEIAKLCCAKYYLFGIGIKLLILPLIIIVAMIVVA